MVTPYPYPYPPIHPKLPGVMGGGVSQNVGPVNAGQTYGSTASPAESGYLPGTILATVPADAKVFLNGHLTQSTGTQRRYICAEMLPGRFYKYVVRVEYVQDNQTVQRSHELIVGAGQTKTLDLDTVGEDVTKIAVSP